MPVPRYSGGRQHSFAASGSRRYTIAHPGTDACLEVPSERGGASGYRGDKLVVRRFIENAASGRDVSVAHDVLAPSYLNLAFEGIDIAGLKAMTTALHAVIGEARTSSLEMVA